MTRTARDAHHPRNYGGLMVKVSIAAAIAGMLTACSAGTATKTSPSNTTPPPVQSVATSTTVPPVDETGRTTCQMLKANETLQSVQGFIIVAGSVNEGDVVSTIDELQLEASEAPAEFQHGLASLAAVLQEIDDSLMAGGGDTIDTSSVAPNAHLLVGMCRARGISIS